MTMLPASMAHVEWDPISLSKVPKCKSWSPASSDQSCILHANDFFQTENVMVLLKDAHGETGAEMATLTVLNVILFSL